VKIIKEVKLKVLIAEDEYLLKEKDDVYVEAFIDENGNEIREHIPYLFKKAYVPENMTIEEAKEIYEEVKEKEGNNDRTIKED